MSVVRGSGPGGPDSSEDDRAARGAGLRPPGGLEGKEAIVEFLVRGFYRGYIAC